MFYLKNLNFLFFLTKTQKIIHISILLYLSKYWEDRILYYKIGYYIYYLILIFNCSYIKISHLWYILRWQIF